MNLEGQKTGIFGMSRTSVISHEVDMAAARDQQEAQSCRMVVQGLMEILKDGRRYEVVMTVSTVSGGTHPLGVQPDGAPCLARPQGTPLSSIYTQYTTSCRLTVVLVNYQDAKVGEIVRFDALVPPPPNERRWRTRDPDSGFDGTFERCNVGWKRVD